MTLYSLCKYFTNVVLRTLLGMNPNWKSYSFHFLGEDWNYLSGIESKAYEGFFEAGYQMILQIYIQQKTGWPSIKPLLGPVEKGIYFKGTTPGKYFQIITRNLI